MPFAPFILLICLVAGIAYLIYVKRKERELIEQVTPITRGEWSERRVVLKLLKADINPKAIFHDLYIQKPNGTYTQVDVAVATNHQKEDCLTPEWINILVILINYGRYIIHNCFYCRSTSFSMGY